MELNKLNIPEKINVGFQERSGTYTGKLAYVIYTDHKGKLRKENSWNNWRNNKIDPEEYENTSTSGFVLNKKVGGTRWGWNPRQTYVRVYDPRGFEFEITVSNLVFILEECSSIKGKGLEGDFVYAWDGKDLLLLPVSSKEYKESFEFTKLQSKKITKKDMIEGCIYINKDTEEWMYLGRHDYCEIKQDWYRYKYEFISTKLHIFVSLDSKSKYWTQKGFTKLAMKPSDIPSQQYAYEYEKFKNSNYGCSPSKIEFVPIKPKGVEITYYGSRFYTQNHDGKYYVTTISKSYYNNEKNLFSVSTSSKAIEVQKVDKGLIIINENENYRCRGINSIKINLEGFNKLKLYKLSIVNSKFSKTIINI